MSSRGLDSWLLALAVIALSAGELLPTQGHGGPVALNAPIDEKTAIRFFYDPSGDYFHAPVVFRAAERGSSQINTAPMREEGRTAYITLEEMGDLARALSRSGLGWQASDTVEALGSYKELPLAGIGLDTMDVRLVSSRGTSKAQISPKAICTILKPLDVALKTPRALWEFQGYRLNYGCKVSGFKYDAYPDHH
jgi:hypothetical protein